jgi:hypothetical protein
METLSKLFNPKWYLGGCLLILVLSVSSFFCMTSLVVVSALQHL